ncbi:methyltransferase family protein [Blastomonas aquatica]|uniref:Protein-S-isoprenylcysteine methyltransferase n=1 Tax=Blastomonas aquatica TaxID=1510276 RepID=A0ABQ1JBH7_9SPHN|nr:isoprenylcysteine carboxylmethyltransferase family protein [Blastomonas aquatica]GGB64636.1 protein-S-isoprenylcysteine methyltransferase [Blastomonas aquatica]
MDYEPPQLPRIDASIAPKVGFPPPLVFVGFILLGLFADRLLSLPTMPISHDINWVGFALMMAGIAVLIVSLGMFRAYGENPEPWTPSQAIIARGPYRHSRNPMYLAMVVIHIGYAIWDASAGVLLFVPFAFIAIDRAVIAKEEKYLTQRFGKPYQDYCRRVRRWL